jgi:beta-glucosidase
VRRAAAATGLPVYITESGIATDDDDIRIAYLDEALRGVGRCLADGVDVRGYFVWSLLDNFEWNSGYAPKLGLYEVDRHSFERLPKRSASWYSGVARTNSL